MTNSDVKTTFFGLDEKEFLELRNFIHDNQPDNAPMQLTHSHVTGLLFNFGRKHDLPAMYRYLQWSLREGEPRGRIMATIGYDLNGAGEYFAPRTESY